MAAAVKPGDHCLIHKNPSVTWKLNEYENDTGFKNYVSSTKSYIRSHAKGLTNALFDVTDHDTTDFPELTDQHILYAFIDSGVCYHHIYQLGIRLGLAEATMQIIKSKTDAAGPAVFAVETVNAWLKKDPRDSIEETFLELEDKLRQVHLNCVIGRLRRKNVQGIAPVLTELVGNATKNVTKDEALTFGEKLGLRKSVIQSVIEESEFTTRGPYIALALYKEAERRNTFIRHSFVTNVASSLMDVCTTSGIDDDEKNTLKERMATIKESSLLSHSQIDSDFERTLRKLGVNCHVQKVAQIKPTPVRTSQSSFDCTDQKHLICTIPRVFKGTIGLVIFLLLLSISLIPISLLVPKLPTIPDILVVSEDVVIYEFTISSSYWLDSLSVKSIGDSRCTVEALAVNCGDVVYQNLDRYEMDFLTDYNYFTKGSSVTFMYQSNAQSSPCHDSSRHIWVFNNLHDAERNAANNFDSLACSNPPEGIMCIKVNSSINTNAIVLPQSSYYFFRCNNDPYCSFLSNFTVENDVSYDFEATLIQSIDSTDVTQGSDQTSLIEIKKRIFHHQYNAICVLARLKDCDDPSSVITMILSGNRSKNFLYYSCLVCGFNTLLLIACACVWLLYTKYVRKETKLFA